MQGANIFLTEELKTLKLGDFGCAVKIKAHTTMPGELQVILHNLKLELFFDTGP